MHIVIYPTTWVIICYVLNKQNTIMFQKMLFRVPIIELSYLFKMICIIHPKKNSITHRMANKQALLILKETPHIPQRPKATHLIKGVYEWPYHRNHADWLKHPVVCIMICNYVGEHYVWLRDTTKLWEIDVYTHLRSYIFTYIIGVYICDLSYIYSNNFFNTFNSNLCLSKQSLAINAILHVTIYIRSTHENCSLHWLGWREALSVTTLLKCWFDKFAKCTIIWDLPFPHSLRCLSHQRSCYCRIKHLFVFNVYQLVVTSCKCNTIEFVLCTSLFFFYIDNTLYH